MGKIINTGNRSTGRGSTGDWSTGDYSIMYKDHLNQEEDTFYWDKKSKN